MKPLLLLPFLCACLLGQPPAPLSPDERLDPANLDRERLARAIFDETNRVRRELKLPEFARSDIAARAADMQAGMCALQSVASHDNPLPGLATVLDRVIRAGFKRGYAAENIALTAMLDVDGATAVTTRRVNGREVFIHPKTGREAHMHTYASFARDVVEQWMNSPGHRANIARKQTRLLGCAVRPGRGVDGADLVFSVQVFLEPAREI